MNMRMMALMVLAGTVGPLSGCTVEQPSAGCPVQDGVWQVTYVLRNPADKSRSCGTLTAEPYGVYKYVVPASQDPNEPATLALRPLTAVSLTTYVDSSKTRRPRVKLSPPADPNSPTDPTGSLRASTLATSLSGSFARQPDAAQVCQASSFGRIRVEAEAAVDEVQGALPARTVDYQFGDLSVYDSPSVPGITFEGSLVFGDGTCTAEYRVLGLFPAIACAKTEDCQDPALGINPELDVVCLHGGCAPNPDKALPFRK